MCLKLSYLAIHCFNNFKDFFSGLVTKYLVQSGIETAWPLLLSALKNHLELREGEVTLMNLESSG